MIKYNLQQFGSRGASSGISHNGKKYGMEYHTVLQSGNIKFVKYNDGAATAPMETMTKGRIYVTLDSENEPKFISYYDKHNKRYKQIDIRGKEHYINGKPELLHTHFGYIHDEKGTDIPKGKEEKMIERVQKIWYYHKRKR